MIVGRIKNANVVLQPPENWDVDRFGPCATLYAVKSPEWRPGITSAWYPTVEEICAISAGAPVYLTILDNRHPPVSLGVGPVPDDSLDGN